jgi:hypothetical protein
VSAYRADFAAAQPPSLDKTFLSILGSHSQIDKALWPWYDLASVDKGIN